MPSNGLCFLPAFIILLSLSTQWKAYRINLELLAESDRVLITSGDHMEVHGTTNTLRLLQVGAGGIAEGLGDL